MPELQQPFGAPPHPPNPGQADRLALLRLYDEMSPEQRAELLRVARGMVKGGQR